MIDRYPSKYWYMTSALSMTLRRLQVQAIGGQISFDEHDQSIAEINRMLTSAKDELSCVNAGADRAKYAHNVINDLIGESLSKVGAVSCKVGCTGCCHQVVDITTDEAKLLSRRVKSGVKIDMDKLRRQAAMKYDTSEWWKQSQEDKACVFLKDGKCSVYSDRPAACRKYFVASDPKICFDPRPDQAVSVVSMNKVEIFVSAFMDMDQKSWNQGLPKLLLKELE